MKRFLLSFSMILGILILAGCGGGGGGGHWSPFAGNWQGSIYINSGPNESMQLSIDSEGNITGSESVGGGGTAADTGTVDHRGDIHIRSRYAGTPDVFYDGTAGFDNRGNMVASGQASQSGNTGTFNFNLRPTG